MELKTELGQLRTQKIVGGASSKLTKMYVDRVFVEVMGGGKIKD